MKSVCAVGTKIRLIDQTKLPFSLVIYTSKTWQTTIRAIVEMKVRGAPAIGITGAYAFAQAVSDDIDPNKAYLDILASRPTAVDLKNALDFMLKNANRKNSFKKASEWSRMIEKKCRKISKTGSLLIKKNDNILTHCHTGAVACPGTGTALGAILSAKKQGKGIFVYVDETRPRVQGALTSWELKKSRVPHKVITDSTAAFLMSRGKVDMVMVGADRIVRNGDVANKIGTYGLAIAAKENMVPFYVLAPSSTLDRKTTTGKRIRIEERDPTEVLTFLGRKAFADGTKALNFAFDVTPAQFVTAYITENGICRNVKELWQKNM